MDIGNVLEDTAAKLRASAVARFPLPGLKIGRRTARLPIVQGGMGVGLSLARLAAAVAEEGGVGVIAATGIGLIEADYYDRPLEANIRALRSEIRKARGRTSGVLGVNIMVAADGFHRLLEAAVAEKIDVLFLGAGLPIKGIPVAAIRAAGAAVVPIVSSGRAARLIFRSWEKSYADVPDAVVVEGPRAGGHLGFRPEQIDDPAYQLEKILPEVVEAVREFETRWVRAIPVIAAGGIYTGDDIHRMMRLGARGVQMGTRFIATEECDADPKFKQAYVGCEKDDIVIIQSPVGLPGRAIRSPFLADVALGIRRPFRCPSHCLGSCGAKSARYCIAQALDHARRGEFEDGFAFCGANAYRVRAVVPVADLISELRQGYALAGFSGSIRAECAKAAEKMRAFKGEYSLTLNLIRERFRDQVKRMTDENRARFREEKARFRGRLVQIRSEYLKAKAGRRALEIRLRLLRNQACLLEP